MIWTDIESDFLSKYPQLQMGLLQAGSSSCRWFYLPEGYRDQKNVMCFGFLEPQSSEEVRELLKQIEAKAKDLGVVQILGPLNLSTFLDYRVKLDYFEDAAYPGEPRNPPWLAKAIEESGFSLERRYFSNEFKILQPRIIGLALYGFLSKWKLRKYGYRFVPLTQSNVFEYLDEIHSIVHEIFHRNYLYLDIPHEVFVQYMKEKYYRDLHADASFVILDKSGQCIGFTLNLHDRANPERLLFKTIGIKTEHSHHGKLMTWLVAEVVKRVWFKHKTCMACLAIESRGIQKKMASVAHKTMRYALYTKKM